MRYHEIFDQMNGIYIFNVRIFESMNFAILFSVSLSITVKPEVSIRDFATHSRHALYQVKSVAFLNAFDWVETEQCSTCYRI